MNSLLKVLVFSCPVLALVFWYVISMQAKHDVHIQREDAAFEQAWNETEAELAPSKEAKEKYLARAKEAEDELKQQKAKEAERERQTQEFLDNFDRQLKELDKKQGGAQ
jgi:uncharacterized protein YgiM (DUF1202 family)